MKSWSPPIVEMMTVKMIVGRIIGTVTWMNCRQRAGAVDRGRLVQLVRDRLHRGEVEERVVAVQRHVTITESATQDEKRPASQLTFSIPTWPGGS